MGRSCECFWEALDAQSKTCKLAALVLFICTIIGTVVGVLEARRPELPATGSAGAAPTSSSPHAEQIKCSLPSVPSSTTGGNYFEEPSCGDALVPANLRSRGVWFSLQGDGSLIALSTCNDLSDPNYDTRIRVYRGTAFRSRECIAGNDDDESCAYGEQLSTAKFTAIQAHTYYILVDGRQPNGGDFTLTIDCDQPPDAPQQPASADDAELSPTPKPQPSTPRPTDRRTPPPALDLEVTPKPQPSTPQPTDRPTPPPAPDLEITRATQVAKVMVSGLGADDFFGHNVAIEGDTAVVGGVFESGGGRAYVFFRKDGTWQRQAFLGPLESLPTDTYKGRSVGSNGSSVAISGDTIVIGSPGNEGETAGSCFVFVRTQGGWTQQAELVASGISDGDNFGTGVAVSGDTAIVGAIRDDGGGAAYVFVRTGTTWAQQAKLTASDAADNDLFGRRVALSASGDTAIVGAQFDDSKSGSAYIFRRSGSTWKQEAKLRANDAKAESWFGFAVAISGDTAIVAAQWDDDGGTNSGSVYVFVQEAMGGWTQQAKLKASDNGAGDDFGYSVAFSGNTLVIGADAEDDNSSVRSGSVYVFKRVAGSTWMEVAKLKALDAGYEDFFGYSVALSDRNVIVGAIGENAAYIFELI